MPTARVVVVTGLKSEAQLLPGRRVAAAGGDARRAYDLALEMAAAGARGLVGFGIAGGLDAALNAGDLVLANAVVRPDGGAYACDPGWRGRLTERLVNKDLTIATGIVAGSDKPLLRPADKRAMALRTRGIAVDMESHGVARAAAEIGLPFLVVRAIADPARRTVPALAADGMGPDGGTRILSVIAGLMAAPGDLPALLAVAEDARKATATLRRVASLGGLDLAL